MAKKRTKKQKITAKHHRPLSFELPIAAAPKASNEPTIAEIAFTGEKVYLIKKDLIKTLLLTVFMFILLFGIYIFIR